MQNLGAHGFSQPAYGLSWTVTQKLDNPISGDSDTTMLAKVISGVSVFKRVREVMVNPPLCSPQL